MEKIENRKVSGGLDQDKRGMEIKNESRLHVFNVCFIEVEFIYNVVLIFFFFFKRIPRLPVEAVGLDPFKVFIEFITKLLLFYVLFCFLGHEACGILVPQPGIKPRLPALEGRVLTTGLLEKYPPALFLFVLLHQVLLVEHQLFP